MRAKAKGRDMAGSTRWAVGVLGFVAALLGAARPAEEGAKEAGGSKPPWQRYLQGDDARKAAEQEKKLDEWVQAGDFAEAEKVAEGLAELRRKVQGADHWEAVNARWGAAGFRSLARQGEDVRKEYVALWALATQARTLRGRGRSREAQVAQEKMLAFTRKVLGEEHPLTADGYNTLAFTLADQGKYAEVREGFHKALAIRRKLLGEDHPKTATSYANLAAVLDAQGKYAEAEDVHRRALGIRRKALVEDHLDLAHSYYILAISHYHQGKYAQAEEGYRKALTIRRQKLGEEHRDTISCYNNLAANLLAQGRYAEAEEGHRKALAIARKALGEAHILVARTYSNLANNQNAQGKYEQAEQLRRRAAEIFARGRLSIAGSGLERAAAGSGHAPFFSLAVVLARNGKPEEAWQRFEEGLARCTWDDLTARRRPVAVRARQAQLIARIDGLNKLIDRPVAARQAVSAPAGRRDELLTELRQALDELADFRRRLEKTYGPVAGQVFGREQIQAALPPDAALVAWLDIRGEAHARDPNGEHWAVLLRPSGDPLWVRLTGSGDKGAWTDADDRLPGQLRSALQSARGRWQPLAGRLRRQRLQPLAKHLGGVRHLVVLPSVALAGVPVEVIAEGATVSYAPSGTIYAHLRRQPAVTGKGLFALADPVFDPPRREEQPPLPPGSVLLTAVLPGSNAARSGLRPNDVLLRYGDRELAEARDLELSTKANGSDSDRPAPVVVWREGKRLRQPLFVQPGRLGVVVATEPAAQALAEQRRLDRVLTSRDGEEGKWDRLPGTRAETAALARLFAGEPTRVLLDSEASEQRLDELAQSGELGKYRYLLLATHGEVDNTAPLRSALILSRDRLPDDKRRVELLLSGRPIPDGRLTAEEVLCRWDLHCELVTVSACQSALGKYEQGEGFVGFAQALVLCGSRSVCLSLWRVDDTATALLMERFYQNLLGKRLGLSAALPKAEALAEARAWLRNLPRKEAAKHAAGLAGGVARGKGPALPPLEAAPTTAAVDTATPDHPFAHPYYWAAFVLVGHAD